jgi:hypothetical protein
MSERDFEFACVHGEVAEAAAPVPGRMDDEEGLAAQGRPAISWRCDVCSYRMLAMDHRGAPLPLERGPRGEVLPVFCSRCGIEHSDWTPVSPFDSLGDHANVRGAFSDKIKSGVPMESEKDVRRIVADSVPAIAQLQKVYAQPDALTRKEDRPNDTYACGRCGRRLLRIDANGHTVPLDVDTRGRLVPLECPGCHETHADWIVASLFTRVKPPPRIMTADAVGGQTEKEREILSKPVRKTRLF